MKDKPIFYHPDSCDCLECSARSAQGGLDHDPSNDDEEFEKHEEQVLKEIEKGSIYKRKFRKNQTIKFKHISDLTGQGIILTGIILGHGKEVRKKWPEEMAEAPDDMLLVWRQDHLGQTFHYAVAPFDVVDIAVKED